MLLRERPLMPADLLPAPGPLPSLTTAFSRRAAIFGATASAGLLVGSVARSLVPVAALANTAVPHGPLTLAQAEELDFAALWASLPAAAQARIGALALRNEMFLQINEDGGFHTTADDRDVAEGLANEALDELRPAIWEALPDVMPTVYDEPYPLWQALDERNPPSTVNVRGLGRVALVKDGWEWFAVTTSARLKLGGAVDLNSRDEGAPREWLFWTVDDIKAERLRRHPEMAGRDDEA